MNDHHQSSSATRGNPHRSCSPSRHRKHRKSSKDRSEMKHHSSHSHSHHHKHKRKHKSDHREHHHHHHHSRSSRDQSRSKIDDLREQKRSLERVLSSRSESSARSIGQEVKVRSHGSGREMMRTSNSVNTSKDRGHSKADIENQTRDLAEALILYGYAERAALRIQREFRARQEQKKLLLQKRDSEATVEESEDDLKKEEEDDGEQQDRTAMYTAIFLALIFAITVLPNIAMSCWNCIKRIFGGDDGPGGGDVEAVANAATQGGGPAGPTPSGGEAGAAGGAQASAQGAMAAQAASSAASGAASGVASGAAAGAAAATAGVTAASVGATQVATVVAVSNAAVAATTSVVVVNTPEPILSTCGLANPDIRSGRMVMLFEGIPRPFDDRESGLVENLVMQSYNEITLGTNAAVTGCLDPLAREMQSISIVNQTLSLGTGLLDPNKLEVVFEAQVSCDRCSKSSPLFSEEQLESTADDSAGDGMDSSLDTVASATTEGVVDMNSEESRRLQLAIDFSSQKFFQKLIQLVIFETEELSDQGELPEGFVQISKALVITTDENQKEEEAMVTEIRYKRRTSSGGGSGGNGSGSGNGEPRATFEFEFLDPQTGQIQKETIEITEEGGVVPTTAFPTFQPSHTPTTNPSSLPTRSPSSKPSSAPTATPSSQPTEIFSGQPTGHPSLKPSRAPSEIPSLVPSDAPSAIPSLTPSDSPSSAPSVLPSMVPSTLPSMFPSMIPSYVPSDSPSALPSFIPSMIPSMIPSYSPSMIPSEAPSDSPSMRPSVVPSASPSKIPTMTPSSQPSATVLLTLPGMAASQSSIFEWGTPDKAIDGNTCTDYPSGCTTHTQPNTDPHWHVNIGGYYGRPCAVKYVTVWNRGDCCWDRIYGAWVQLLDASGSLLQERQITSAIGGGAMTLYFDPTPNVYWIRVRLWGAEKILSISELRAYGYVS